MEKLISIDPVGRTVLPKSIREAVHLGKGGPAKIRLAPGEIIEIEPIAPTGRKLRKAGKFLVGVSDRESKYDPCGRCARGTRCAMRGADGQKLSSRANAQLLAGLKFD